MRLSAAYFEVRDELDASPLALVLPADKPVLIRLLTAPCDLEGPDADATDALLLLSMLILGAKLPFDFVSFYNCWYLHLIYSFSFRIWSNLLLTD